MNILLIEDDRKITEALSLAFAAEGYKTIPCRTCADAYATARVNAIAMAIRFIFG